LDKADNGNMELNFGPMFEAITPLRTPSVFNLFYCLCFSFTTPFIPPIHHRSRNGGVRSTLSSGKTLFLSAHSISNPYFFPTAMSALRHGAKNGNRPPFFTVTMLDFAPRRLSTSFHARMVSGFSFLPICNVPSDGGLVSACLPWSGICLCAFRLAFTPQRWLVLATVIQSRWIVHWSSLDFGLATRIITTLKVGILQKVGCGLLGAV